MRPRRPAPLPALLPEALRASATRVTLAGGQALFKQGDPVGDIFYVLRGEMLALRHLPDGTEAVMQRARSGEFFAQAAMQLSHHACNARAATASELVRLPVRQLAQALATDARFAWTFPARLACDLRRQCTRVERLLMKLGRDRVLHYLVCEGSPADQGLSIADLAEEVGLDPCTVSRLIAELRASGELVGRGRHIQLAPAYALSAAAPRRATGLPS